LRCSTSQLDATPIIATSSVVATTPIVLIPIRFTDRLNEQIAPARAEIYVD
jgi:hypothetical protein